jgi:hypothetical protein
MESMLATLGQPFSCKPYYGIDVSDFESTLRPFLIAVVAPKVAIHGRGQSEYHRCLTARIVKTFADFRQFVSGR